ncbi:MAG: VIT domain-containing protein [Anaerolinea sp.]
MAKRIGLLIALLAGLLFGWTLPVQADGIIIPPPCPPEGCPPVPCIPEFCPPVPPRPMSQLVIRYHHVNVTIQNQLATTRVDQVFYNPNRWAVEGVYLFPLPAGAVVSDFKLWVDDQPVEGKILNAEEARKLYEDTVRSLKDPGLLEYVGRGAVQARVFPIDPGEERRIALEYQQVLVTDHEVIRYAYPLNTEKYSALPLEDVSIEVQIRDQRPVRTVYSSSHAVQIERKNDNEVNVRYTDKNVLPDRDFELLISLGEGEALHLFSYRDPGDVDDADGFFLMLLAPRIQSPEAVIPKDVIFVLDRSGSMEGVKFQQAKQALEAILTRLNSQDRFNLISFSNQVELFAPELAGVDAIPAARRWLSGLSAAGGTNIHRALLEAAGMVQAGRPAYLIFLTDGLPTVGITDRDQILDDFARKAPENLRLFVFGVGYDVDTFLLDRLVSEHHGLSLYVRPEEDLNKAVASFYEKISTPVLTDLRLTVEGTEIYDVYPQPIPDLFAGTQVVITGRYRQPGRVTVVLTGNVSGEPRTYRFSSLSLVEDSRFQITESEIQLPRLWATRKIGYLLEQIRLNGADPETIEQIVRLSIRYGIITPYTSYLVTESMPLGAEAQSKIAGEAYRQSLSLPTVVSGEGAFNRAMQEGAMQRAESVPASPAGVGVSQTSAVRLAGNRTFVWKDNEWVDTLFDPNTMKPVEIPFLSDAYFQLAQYDPQVASALAVGDRVLVVIGGKAYRIIPEAEPGTLVPGVELPTVPPAEETETVPSTPLPSSESLPGIGVCPSIGLFPLGVLLAFALTLRKRK